MNRNYSQVATLLEQGKLHWESDVIMAFICSGATFHAGSVEVAQEGGRLLAKVPVSGRVVVDGKWLGRPIIYDYAQKNAPYQVILARDLGAGRTKALAFFDTVNDGEAEVPIQATKDGTLVVRPEITDIEGMSYGTGIWMVVETEVPA